MTIAEVLDLLWKGVAIAGGGVVVIGGIAAVVSKFVTDRAIESHKSELTKEVEQYKSELSKEIERLKGELAKEAESHKLNLRKAEILFGKELDAASEFIAIHRKMRPQYSHPDKDWDEACEEVAENFGTIEDTLEKFVIKHGVILSKKLKKQIQSCIDLASQNKFAVSGEAYGDMKEAKTAADKLLKSLPEIEDQFIAGLHP